MPVEPEISGNNPENNKKRKILILILVGIFALAGAFYYGLQLHHQKELNSVLSYEGVLSEDELNSLDQYPNLETVNLTGSTCYDAILNYASTHPDVKVLYSVPVDGTEIENTTTDLDWAGHSVSLLTEAAPWLQNLKHINLGTTNATSDELSALSTAFFDAQIKYFLEFNGKKYNNNETTIDLSDINATEVNAAAELIRKLPALKTVILSHSDGSSNISFDDYVILYSVNNNIDFQYQFNLFGKDISTEDSEIRFLKTEVGSEGLNLLREKLPYLPKLTYLSLDRCNTTDEEMAELRDDFPDIKIVWRIYFGEFSCMTDAEKIWAIGSLEDSDTAALKYCTDIKYIDVGHNNLTDVNFLSYMPNLEVAILAINPLSDISVLAQCKNLEYLELTLTNVSDISALSSCTNLKHLELSQTLITDISPIMNLDLVRFHMMYHHHRVSDEQFQEFIDLHPDCDVNFSNSWEEDPYNESDWRYSGGSTYYSERYALLRKQIGYDDPYGKTLLYPSLDDVN